MLQIITNAVFGLLDQIIPDSDKAREAKAKLQELEKSGELAILQKQIEANIAQAKHPSFFVSGARPAAMWVCILAFGFGALVSIVAPAAVAIGGYWAGDLTVQQTLVDLKNINIDAYIAVLSGLLGLGGFRMAEKFKGVARSNLES